MQVKESVNAANLLLVGSQAGQSAPKPQADTVSSDFASFLTNASEKTDTGVKDTGVKDSKMVKVDSQNRTEDTYTAETGNETNNLPDKVTEKPIVESKAEDVPEDVVVDVVEEVVPKASMELSEEDTKVLLELVGQLLQNVMTQFDLSVAELPQQLERFDMAVEGLFTKDGLKEFFLKMNSAEVSDLIVDENMNQEFNSFLGELEEVVESLETVDLDFDSLLTDETVDEVLNDFPEVAELVQHMEVESQELVRPKVLQSEQSQEMQPDLTDSVEEPEVVVTKTENRETENQSGMSGQQEQEKTSGEALSEQDKIERPQTERKEPQKTFVNPILQAIENAVDNVQEIAQADNQPMRGADVINQIVEQVRIQMNQDTTSLEMQLYPEHLGKIQIHVVSKDGIMTARIVAETEAAKQAIENGLTNLKESMQEQNLKVDAIEVMVSTTGFERGNEGQNSETNNQTTKGRRKLDLSESEQDMTDEEAAEEERMRASGSSVSYTA